MLWLIRQSILSIIILWSVNAFAVDIRGDITVEYTHFLEDPTVPAQHGDNASVSTQPEFYQSWDDGYQSVLFTPFLRIDQHDEERTHFDIRELRWLGVYEFGEMRVGIRKVFWGVTESQHLVDIINQTDLVENIDGEDKLGQPMINAAFINDWGTLDLYVLTGFRERTFPGKEGRPRTIPYVDTDQATYESSQEEKHIDYAARYSHYIEAWEFGVSQFYGTSRDPNFSLGSKDGEAVLIPNYPIINQTGLDVQAIIENWLLKLELISRDGQIDRRYTAATGGFEYTIVMLFDTRADLGIITEYLYDDRGAESTPFQNDLFAGGRLAFNDVQSTEILAGVIYDLDDGDRFYNLEAERRLGDTWKLSVEARIFSNFSSNSAIYAVRNDDYLQAELAWYF
jgi:hypothetical protein